MFFILSMSQKKDFDQNIPYIVIYSIRKYNFILPTHIRI